MTDKIDINAVRAAVQSLKNTRPLSGQPFYGQVALGVLRQWDKDGELSANLKEVVDGLPDMPDNLVIVLTDKTIDVLTDKDGNLLSFA